MRLARAAMPEAEYTPKEAERDTANHTQTKLSQPLPEFTDGRADSPATDTHKYSTHDGHP